MDELFLVVHLEEMCHIALQTIGTNCETGSTSGYREAGWSVMGASGASVSMTEQHGAAGGQPAKDAPSSLLRTTWGSPGRTMDSSRAQVCLSQVSSVPSEQPRPISGILSRQSEIMKFSSSQLTETKSIVPRSPQIHIL